MTMNEKYLIHNGNGEYVTRRTIGSEYSLCDTVERAYLFDTKDEALSVFAYCMRLKLSNCNLFIDTLQNHYQK